MELDAENCCSMDETCAVKLVHGIQVESVTASFESTIMTFENYVVIRNIMVFRKNEFSDLTGTEIAFSVNA